MARALRWAAAAALLAVAAGTGGCSQMISSQEFLAKYTTNIAVPHPNKSQVSTRSFLGEAGGYYYLKDSIPFDQGGGLLGKTIYWRCPVAQLPPGFLRTHQPGDVVFNAMPGSKEAYMIQWYRTHKSEPQAPAPPSQPAPEE